MAQLGFARGLVRYEFSPTIGVSAARVDTLGLNIKSFREPLKRSVQWVLAPSIQKNFKEGGRPEKWEPLSEFTLVNRQNFGISGTDPLIRTGALMKVMGQLNIWTIDTKTAIIQDLPQKVWYGKIHQGGKKGASSSASFADVIKSMQGGKRATGKEQKFNTTPARPFAMIQPEDERAVVKVFDDWLASRMRASGYKVRG